MTRSTAVDLPSGRQPAPGRVGQSTAVEQSRAVAEVQAAVVLAHQVPRDENAAVDRMREACARPQLAARAFYRMPRAGGTVSGPSIHLARELARIWGNVQYGIAELDRDVDAGGRSEMLARAWDLESNTLVTSSFIVPHARDKGSGSSAKIDPLTTLAAVYEGNANAGARRVRECIFAVLPPWFREEAMDLCRATIEKGDGDPLQKRVAWIISMFEPLGIREEQLARKVGKPAARWTPYDLADLQVIGGSIKRGEVTAADEFPPAGVTARDIEAQASNRPPEPDNAASYDVGKQEEPQVTADAAPAEQDRGARDEAMRAAASHAVAQHEQYMDRGARMMTDGRNRRLHKLLGPYGLTDDARRDDKLAALTGILDRPVATSKELTDDEARVAVDMLEALEQGNPDQAERDLIMAEHIVRGREILATTNPKD